YSGRGVRRSGRGFLWIGSARSSLAPRAGFARAAGFGEALEVDPAGIRAVEAPAADARTGDEEGPAGGGRLQAEARIDVIRVAVTVFVARVKVWVGPAHQLDAVRPARAAGFQPALGAQLAVMDAPGGDGVLQVAAV